MREDLRSSLDLARRAGTLRVRNVLNPLLWLTAVATPSCFAASGFIGVDHWLGVVLAIAGLAPIVAALLAYGVFAQRDPDRLQSEEYVIRSMELRILERRGAEPMSLDDVPVRDDPALDERHGRYRNEP